MKKLTKMETRTGTGWRELIAEKKAFCEIVKLLVDFDEKTERVRRHPHPETHYMRKAVGVADPGCLRVFVLPHPEFPGEVVYEIIVELSTECGWMYICWIHEDGIRAEREIFRDQMEHPVHSIVCMSDLYEEHSRDVSEFAGLTADDVMGWLRQGTVDKSEEKK